MTVRALSKPLQTLGGLVLVSLLAPFAGVACDTAQDTRGAADQPDAASRPSVADQPDAADAADATGQAPPPPPPSAYPEDPAILAIVNGMGDNAAVELEPFKLGGDRVDEWVANWGSAPQRRDFCNKIVFAPDRGTGQYAGMNHGAPHRLNDAWEYHLASNTWYLLYFPIQYRKDSGWLATNAMIQDGYMQTKSHGMVSGFHTWDGLAYDSVLKRMLWANIGDYHYRSDADDPELVKNFAEQTGQELSAVKAQLRPGTTMSSYDVPGARWHRQLGAGPLPPMRMMGGSLEYVTHIKKTIWYAAEWNESGMWAYDSATNTWEDLKPNKGSNPYHTPDLFPGAEAQIRYSAKHRKLVAVRGPSTFEYDVDANEWSKVGEDPANNADDSVTAFVYDSVNDVFLLLNPKAGGSLRAYRISTKTWETLSPVGPDLPTAVAGYFDPAHNVMVVYSNARPQMWLYRYKRAN